MCFFFIFPYFFCFTDAVLSKTVHILLPICYYNSLQIYLHYLIVTRTIHHASIRTHVVKCNETGYYYGLLHWIGDEHHRRMKALDEGAENNFVPFVIVRKFESVIMRKFERKNTERKSICESRVVKAREMASIFQQRSMGSK